MEVPKLTFTAFTKEEVIYEESQKPEPVSKTTSYHYACNGPGICNPIFYHNFKSRILLQNTILKPIQENDCVIYPGKIEGQPTCFTVSEDKKSCFNMVQQRMDCIR